MTEAEAGPVHAFLAGRGRDLQCWRTPQNHDRLPLLRQAPPHCR
jgi:hypothetical protein